MSDVEPNHYENLDALQEEIAYQNVQPKTSNLRRSIRITRGQPPKRFGFDDYTG